MKNAQHTPGPWYIAGEDEAIVGVPCIEIMHGVCPSPECETICYVDCDLIDDKHVLTKKNYANAHLISAAPELLEALEKIAGGNIPPKFMREGESKADFQERIWVWSQEIARAAIAKARGEA